MTPHAALMLKAPRPGTVKTRLASCLGTERAAQLYRNLVEHTVAVVQSVGWTSTVWFDPPDAEREMRTWLGSGFTYRPQPSGNLGVRLAAAARAVPAGAPAVLLGGDCPGLSATLLHQSIAQLEAAPVVIGPALDGGYYLLALRSAVPDLFTSMPWSTDRLMEATRVRLRTNGVDWRELPTLRDVDTLADAVALGLVASAHP